MWRTFTIAGLFFGLVAAIVIGHQVNPAHAQSGETGGADTTAVFDDAEAQAIDRMLMCPVCPAENIDQAQVPLARQMRNQVRRMLADGADREQVLAWFADRYGLGILAEPPRSGFNLIAWIVPGVALALALAGGLLTLRAMRRRPAVVLATTTADASDLQPYLAAVDRELALEPSAPREPSAPGESGASGETAVSGEPDRG